MAFQEINNDRIVGLAACVPAEIEENKDLSLFPSPEEKLKFMEATGVERRRVAKQGVCTSDLCFASAEKLITELCWEKSEIECLVFVTTSPDYIIPATSCILQDRLGLSKECMSFDISLGCSGWVYGLSTIASIVSASKFKKALLLAGDTTTQLKSPKDKSTWPLFGDAGTATAIEYCDDCIGLKTHIATDGKNYQAIMIQDGGHRHPFSLESLKEHEYKEGIIRNNLQTRMNGIDVFSFGISKAPQSVRLLFKKFILGNDEIDFFIFHQANKYMNEIIRKKLDIPLEKVPYSLKNFGNTSSASIPLTMVSELWERINSSDTQSINIVACGFGVGLSYGSVMFNLNNAICCRLIEL
jgi:3-oxoacyl-[acyl-carrier-protein] synthase-3